MFQKMLQGGSGGSQEAVEMIAKKINMNSTYTFTATKDSSSAKFYTNINNYMQCSVNNGALINATNIIQGTEAISDGIEIKKGDTVKMSCATDGLFLFVFAY